MPDTTKPVKTNKGGSVAYWGAITAMWNPVLMAFLCGMNVAFAFVNIVEHRSFGVHIFIAVMAGFSCIVLNIINYKP